MRIRSPHEWDVEPSRAVEIQEELWRRISLEDAVNLQRLRTVAGADVACIPGEDTPYAAVVVLSVPELKIAEERWVKGKTSFPYIPGLRSFREAPILLRAFSLCARLPMR